MEKASSSSDPVTDPFADLQLSSQQALHNSVRKPCTGPCGKQRRYFCSECLVPLVEPVSDIPSVTLPLHVHILQCASERPQQSTAQHVALLASNHATVWRPFPQCSLSFQTIIIDKHPSNSIAVLYPCEEALSPEEAATEMKQLQHLIVIDATWTKSSVLMDEASWLQKLPRVALPPSSVRSRFWRYAPLRSEHSRYFSPDKVPALVSTVEAVHRFCDAFGRASGKTGEGQCDDLLWLFAFLHGRVREVYTNAPQKRERILRKSKGLLNQF